MRVLPVLLLLLLLSALPAAAQRLERPLRVYLDCSGFFCDQDFFLQEIPWVTFVRDRQDADVHVLGTRQPTGAGGSAYTLELRGRAAFEGQRLTLLAASPPDATESERRSTLVQTVRMGLAPFAASTPSAPVVEIRAAEAAGAEAEPEADPWDRWVFRFGVNGFVNGESQQQSLNGSGFATAARVTSDWKTQLSIRGSGSRSVFELNDSTTFTSRTESYGGGGLIVRSLGPHWGAGLVTDWRRSTFANYDASVVVGGAIEYNVFPYSESTRRLLTLLYAFGPRHNDYRAVTIFGERAETLIEQLFAATYDVTQPWGSVNVAVEGSHFVAKFGSGEAWTEPQYSAQLSGGFDVRLFRGLSANLFGRTAMVRNQIQLAAAGLTEEEILTRQRELATNYRYFASFGLSYRFGSIFSQVVNPRFGLFD